MRLSALLSRISLFASLPALVLALIALLGVRTSALDLATGLKLMVPAIALALVGLVSGGAWTWSALKANESRGWRFGGIGFAIALAILAPAATDTVRRFSSPSLVDITTDPGEPPQFIAVLAERSPADNPPDYDGTRTVLYQGKETTALAVQKKEYPTLRPYGKLFPGESQPTKVMFWRAFEAAKRMGWSIVSFDEKTGHIEATDSSLFFGTKDDIAIDVRPAGKTGARVEMRSKSRMGDNDRGANAARIKAYVEEVARR